jgi:ABC-type polar amino acid transport system ATPase subunit
MNKRTEKTPCKPESVLGKIPFSTKSKSNRISSQKINHRNTKKRERNNCIRKFEMLFHEYEIFNVKSVVQKLHQKQFNAILSYLNRKPVFNATP